MRIIIDEKEFSKCINVFETTMNISCAHTIQVILTTNENFDKLRLNDVHFHWKFKKSEFSNDNFDDNLFAFKFFYESKLKRHFEFDFDMFDVDVVIRDNQIDSIVRELDSNDDENLMNIVEFKKFKIKERSFEFKNKKNLMINI